MTAAAFVPGRFYRRNVEPPYNAVFLCARNDEASGGALVLVDVVSFTVKNATRISPDWFNEVGGCVSVVESGADGGEVL